MKSISIFFTMIFLTVGIHLTAQIDIQPDAIAINECDPLSELAINTKGDAKNTVHIISEDDVQTSAAIYAEGFDVTTFGDTGYGIVGATNFGNTGNFAYGVLGTSIRTSPSNNGRSAGVYAQAGNATPGANYGIFADLQGTNVGAAVVGYDRLTNGGWSRVLPFDVSYAGYFRGNGYFHDNLGVGEEDPQAKIHVKSGDIYVEGSANGIILEGGGSCFRITVDGSGNLTTTSVSCP